MGDISENSVNELGELLIGIDILVIMVSSLLLGSQEKILLAASKCQHIKRVVPSEFAIVYHETNPVVKDSTVLRNVSRAIIPSTHMTEAYCYLYPSM